MAKRTALLFAASVVVAACSRAPGPPQMMVDALVAPPALDTSASAIPAAGAKPFGAPCVADAECTGGVCFHKRLKSPDAGKESRAAGGSKALEHDGYCSMSCNQDSDCPVPPTRGKCGARGMCKRPE